MAAKIFKAFRFTVSMEGMVEHDYLILAANTSKEAENILRESGQINDESYTYLETDETAERNESIPVITINRQSRFPATTMEEFAGWKRGSTTNVYDAGELIHGPIYRLIR